MKLHFLLLYCCFVFFFNGHDQFNAPGNKVPAEVKTKKLIDTTDTLWIEDFRVFRDAVYHNDTAKAKSFFKFPLSEENAEIWFLVLTEEELKRKDIGPDKTTTFTEKDFSKYYKKLFPNSFIKALLKIKTAELYKKGSTETAELQEAGNSSIKMYASFDSIEKKLTLNAAYKTIFKMESGEAENTESNVIYTFKLLKDGHLQFQHIRIAG